MNECGCGRVQGIVHRIDRFTSGLLVVARTNAAHEHLHQQFRTHSITRRYLCVVSGFCKADEVGCVMMLFPLHFFGVLLIGWFAK